MKPVETACKTRFLCVLYAQGQTFSLQTAFATPDNCAPLLPAHIARSRVLYNLRQPAFPFAYFFAFGFERECARSRALRIYYFYYNIYCLFCALLTYNNYFWKLTAVFILFFTFIDVKMHCFLVQKEYINWAFTPGVGRNSSLSVAINWIVLPPAAIIIFVFPEEAIFTAETARLSEPLRLCLEGAFSFFLCLTGLRNRKRVTSCIFPEYMLL